MKQDKVLLLLGHPNNDSLCAALLAQYAQGLQTTGAEVRSYRIADLNFDPSLHLGYNQVQALEPDLQRFQADVAWCTHLVIAFPLWWGGTPAVLKGLIDRTFLPGFAFKYLPNNPLPAKLLKGRSVHLLMTMDSPDFWYRWVLGRPLSKALKRQIFGFSGFAPFRLTTFGNVRGSTPAKRQKWLQQAENLGRQLR